MIPSGICRMPSAVSRTTGGMPNTTVAGTPGGLPVPNEGDDRDEINERRHCRHKVGNRQRDRIGPIALSEPDPDPHTVFVRRVFGHAHSLERGDGFGFMSTAPFDLTYFSFRFA